MMRMPRRRDGRPGQVIVLFAICLVAMIAMAGLLVDGGMAWSNHRKAQAAADTAALAAAHAASNGKNHTTAAEAIASDNGFPDTFTDCTGAANASGVVVHLPPTSGPHAGNSGFVEVITSRANRNAFAGVVGMGCWIVAARAVASIKSSAAWRRATSAP